MLKKIFTALKLFKTDYQKTKKLIKNKLKTSTVDTLDVWVEQQISSDKFKAIHAYRILFSVLKQSHPEKAIFYGEKAQKIHFSLDIDKVLTNRKLFVKKKQFTIEKFKDYYANHTIKESEKWAKEAIKVRPEIKMPLYKAFFTLAKKKNAKVAIQYGEKAILLGADKAFKKVVQTRKRWLKNSKTTLDIDISDISIKELKDILDEMIETSPYEAYEYIKSFQEYDENIVFSLSQYLIKKINKSHLELTVEIATHIFDKLKDKSLLKIVAARAYAIQDYENTNKFYKKLFQITKDYTFIDRIVISLFYIQVMPNNYQNDYLNRINTIIDTNFKRIRKKKRELIKYKLLFEFLIYKENYVEAIEYGLKIISAEKNEHYSLKLAKAYFSLGEISNALTQSSLDENNDAHKKLIALYSSYLNLKDYGFSIPAKRIKYTSDSHKILNVLNNSLPYHSNGYSTRAHGLLKGIKQTKEIEAITRLGYPHDLAKLRNEEMVTKHSVEGITYYHLPSENQWLNYIPLDDYIKSYGDALVSHIQDNNIKIIHSASNFINGLAANYAAQILGIYSIYEVRGLWEITRISRQPEWENSEHFEMIKRLEIDAAKSANIVITLTFALKEELVKRGIKSNKIIVLPNGVDTRSFYPLKKDTALMKTLNISKNEIIIGYIGSIVEYEGIDLLIEALSKLKDKNINNFKFLLVGDGRYFDVIKLKIIELNIENLVIVTGRIPHEEVEKYYSLVDIAPLPRKSLPVSEMVSPLKPFEAMAMGKVVLGSDVQAIAEIIDDGYNGMLFEKSNVKDLTDKLQILLEDEALRTKIGNNARNWVIEKRDWSILAKQLDAIYEKLINV